MTTHEPSTEHDLSHGLRENFDARARWRAAIASARALYRLKRMGSSRQSTSSGGWKGNDLPSGSDGEDDEHGNGNGNGNGKEGGAQDGLGPAQQAEEENEHVVVTSPSLDGGRPDQPADPPPPATQPSTGPRDKAEGKENNTPEMSIPGSFDEEIPHNDGQGGATWGDLFKKLSFKSS